MWEAPSFKGLSSFHLVLDFGGTSGELRHPSRKSGLRPDFKKEPGVKQMQKVLLYRLWGGSCWLLVPDGDDLQAAIDEYWASRG